MNQELHSRRNAWGRCLAIFAMVVLAHGAVFSQPGLAPADPQPETMAEQLGATQAYPQNLVFNQFEDGELLLEVNLPAVGPVTLSLYPHSVRSDRFQVLVDDGNSLQPIPAPPVRTRRGTILEIPGSKVSGSYDGSSLTGLIRTGTETYSIVPAHEAGYSGDPAWHVIIDENDVIDNGELCGTSALGGSGSARRNPAPQAFGTTYYLTEVGIDADFEFYQQNGSNVGNTVADIENVMNSVSEVYEDLSISITYEISILIVRTTSSDPYGTISNAGQLLGTFNNVWSSSPENQVPRDVAHFFTGINIDGGTIGIANLSDICTSNAYGLSQSRFSSIFSRRVALTTHELGHNWSSTHCDSQGSCRIMCSVLSGCNGISPLSFAPGPVGQIVNYRNSRNCLSSKPPALALPFLDEFPAGVVDSNLWIYNEGGIVSSQGNGEPSGPSSLQLNRSGNGPYEFDEIRSNVMLLAGTNPVLQFYTNHTGVEPGEELIVEYLNAALSWVELDRIVSTGGAPSAFAVQTYDLPPNARHDGFRIRFITNTNENSDNWYIDDVSVSDGPPPTLDPPLITGINPPDGSTAGGAFVTITGENFTSDVAVLVGNALIDNLSYVSATQLVGNVPPAVAPGFVAVIASQASGSSLLNPGFLYTEEFIVHDSAEGSPGGPVAVTVSADHDTVISGYSLAVDFDANDVVVSSITADNSVAVGADFFEPAFNNDQSPSGGWWTLGAILSFTGTTTIPPSDQTVLATANYILQPTVAVGAQIPLTMVNGVGPAIPPSENLLVDPGGNAVPPLLEGGFINVGANSFIRGDGNNDLTVNVADAVFILNFLFSSLPSDCLDALDTNDDGGTDIADAVAVLAFLFSSGSAPPPPYPNPGPDPTADALDCNN